MPRRNPPRDRARRGASAPPQRDARDDLLRDAEYAQRQGAICASKARYGSEAEARAHALMHSGAGGAGPRVKTYRCEWCDGWHFTRG